MVRAKNYETTFTFVEVMQKKTVASFFLDMVYIVTLVPCCTVSDILQLIG